MTKGDITRQHIIEQAAPVFNRKGYAGTSIADIMQATGLKKGGIYNHFSDKNELALAAFDYSLEKLNAYIKQELAGIESPLEKIITHIEAFGVYKRAILIEGGCPIMNIAIEFDDLPNPELNELKARAIGAFSMWEAITRRRIEKAIARGEVRANVDPAKFASLMISSIEGAVMLSRIHSDFAHLDRVIDHLLEIIETNIRA